MKVILNGETFEWDSTKKPMSEALAIEKEWGRRYSEYELELQAGSAEAFGVLAWVIWRREGREVALKDILSGAVDFDYGEFARNFYVKDDKEEQEPDPTTPAGPPSGPAGTPGTPESTKASSPSSST